jgi:hypothetical protein
MKRIRLIGNLCNVVLFMLFIGCSIVGANDMTAIKQGYNDYWSNIKNGRGMCTIQTIQFDPENPDNIKTENVMQVYWVFMGNKIGYCMNIEPADSDPLKVVNLTIYFDGEKVRDGIGKNTHLREPSSFEITITNEWDPRLIAIMTRRDGKSWEPYPIWEEWNWKTVGKEKIGDSECYIVEALTELPDKTQRVNRRWIDPNRSFCAVKGESWLRFTKDSVLPEEREWLKTLGDTLINQTDIELQKYGDDIWGPAKFTEVVHSINPEKKNFYVYLKHIITYDKQCAYNLNISEKDLESEFLAIAAKLQEANTNRPEFQVASACITNLKQVGLAMHLYAQDHNKKLPNDLKELYPKYINNPAIFWCPADTDPKPTDITNSEQNALNSCQISYIYYPGHSVGEPNADKIVIMEDNSPAHHGGRENKLFLDGHCELK